MLGSESLYNQLRACLESGDPCQNLSFWELNPKNEQFLVEMLDKISLAVEKSPEFFEESPQWWHLWGNLLVEIYINLHSEAHLERAIKKFEKAQDILQGACVADLLWDHGRAYIFLGVESGESHDLRRGLALFRQAREAGCLNPRFWIDFGRGLTRLGRFEGRPEFLDEAIELIEKGIFDAFTPEQEAFVYEDGWAAYAGAHAERVRLTGDTDLFFEADTIFNKAIQAAPECDGLWVDWAELFLRAGWQRKHIQFIETAIEKLTSPKATECDPIRVSLLLGEALVCLGAMTDNLRWIHEGEERLIEIEELASDLPAWRMATGQAHLARAIYYEEESAFRQAVGAFDTTPSTEESLFGLFEAYYVWGLSAKSPGLLQTSLYSLERLTELCPFKAFYWHQWGTVLVVIHKMTGGAASKLEEALTKFRKALDLSHDLEWLFGYGSTLELFGDETSDPEQLETAIKYLYFVFEKMPESISIATRLGSALLHYGELTGDVESLTSAAHLFERLVGKEQDDESAWCSWGYALINLAQLTKDPALPHKEGELMREAEKKLAQASTLGSVEALYHLACLYSLTGHLEASVDFLIRTERAGGLPALEDVYDDDWLALVRQTEAFKEFSTMRGSDGRTRG